MTELLSRPPRPRAEIRPLGPLDLVIIAAGALALIFSFFSYYTVTIVNVSSTTSAWHGFWGWFSVLLAVGAALLVALTAVAPDHMTRRCYLGAVGLFGLALVSAVIALFYSGFDTSGPDAYALHVVKGHGYGYWTSLGAILVGGALSLIKLRQAGASER
jgi:hypothetical protein